MKELVAVCIGLFTLVSGAAFAVAGPAVAFATDSADVPLLTATPAAPIANPSSDGAYTQTGRLTGLTDLGPSLKVVAETIAGPGGVGDEVTLLLSVGEGPPQTLVASGIAQGAKELWTGCVADAYARAFTWVAAAPAAGAGMGRSSWAVQLTIIARD
jgi:hypothetical protein